MSQRVKRKHESLLALKPLKGVNYQPSPSDYRSLPPPSTYFDSDFTNQDFIGLWGPNGNRIQKGRNDILTIKRSLHSNVIKMFNWNPSRNHQSFLDYCQQNDLKVIIPISNYFVLNVSQQQSNIINIIKQGQHPSVIAFSIGNELSMSNTQNIARVFQLVVKNDGGNRSVCSPIKQNDFPSLPAEIQKNCHSLGLFSQFDNLFFQAINVYPPPKNVVNGALDNLKLVVNSQWPHSQFASQPLLITEYGWNSATTSFINQGASIGSQARFISENSKDPNKPLFLGGVLFEFSDELWKPDEGGGYDGDSYGLYTFADQFTNDSTTTNQSYRIDQLSPKDAFITYKNNIR